MSQNSHQCGPIRYTAETQSDVGRVRQNNEDSVISAPALGLFGVCDGLGGHAAGEVASALASETLMQALSENSLRADQALLAGIETANQKILEKQREQPSLSGMGTTLSVVWLRSDEVGEAWIGHIGDSRIYRLREGEFSQVTEDHSPVFRLHKQGVITREQMFDHPQKNLLDRSLGITEQIALEVFGTRLREKDLLLICTDGLSDLLKDAEIKQILMSTPLDDACLALVESANEKGGYDNITVCLMSIETING